MASLIPDNSAVFSLDEIAGATGGQVVRRRATRVCGVSTDSRLDSTGKCFVALRGETFDGHQFLLDAVARGAACLVVETGVELPPTSDTSVVVVESTLSALGALAAFHRRQWGGRLVAVAGSVGKTTTRCAAAALMRSAYSEVHSPPGNLNNRVGLPAVLLGLESKHEAAVVELGTSEPGEVAELTRMSVPDVAVLTRIAIEHAEGLGDLDAIEREEGDVFRFAPPTATLITNADDARCVRQLQEARAGAGVKYSLEPLPGVAYTAELNGLGISGAEVRVSRPEGPDLAGCVPLLGEAGAYALLGAVAAAEAALGRPLVPGEWQDALSRQSWGEPGRLVPRVLGDGSVLLDDTYNSSPASLRSSIQFAQHLASARKARLLLVVGEMRELGALSQTSHAEIGRFMGSIRGAEVVAFGGDARFFITDPPGSGQRYVETTSEAVDAVLSLRQPNDVILVKASRGLRAERIVAALCEEQGAHE